MNATLNDILQLGIESGLSVEANGVAYDLGGGPQVSIAMLIKFARLLGVNVYGEE